MKELSKGIGLKLFAIGLIAIVITYILFMLSSLVHERQYYAMEVIEGIKADNFTEQKVTAPMLYIPLKKQCLKWNKKEQKQCSQQPDYHLTTVAQLEWNNNLNVKDNVYKRGLYNAINYDNHMQMKGTFEVDLAQFKANKYITADIENAKIIYAVTDLRGLKSDNYLTIGEEKFDFEFALLKTNNTSSARPYFLDNEVLAVNVGNILKKNLATTPKIKIPFRLESSFAGIETVSYIPMGDNVIIHAKSNWADPNFYGQSLPHTREITAKGFTASWNNKYLNIKNRQLINNDEVVAEQEYADNFAAYSIRFQQPVNIYSQTDRALKYSFLFVVITFACLFLFTTCKQINFHPIQYLLVGIAQAMFYLILLSFSEYIAFGWSYLGGSIACIGLISFYLAHIMGSGKAVGTLTMSLTIMYATLYLLLQTKDYTLILGTSLVFVILALIMITTRKVNWYTITQQINVN